MKILSLLSREMGGLAFSLLIAINSAYNLAKAAGGIYSTVTDAGTSYDKAEAFAHDAALMMMSVFFLKGAVVLGTKSLSTCKSVVQDLIGRTTRVEPLKVIQGAKGIETITSLEEFLECVKGFLDEDALQYAKELLNNDADDIVELKKIARLLEEGSQKIGKKLSKEEFKAGLDALWGNGAEAALEEIERYSKWGKLIESVNDLTLEQREAFTKYTGDAYENINNSLRGLEDATAENQETINIMKSALDNASLPRDMVLYRGTSREALGALKNLPPEDLINQRIVEPAFLSTSTRQKVAQGSFAGSVQMKIEASKGVKALDISSISQYKTESEILFNLGQRMQISAAREERGILYITVTIE